MLKKNDVYAYTSPAYEIDVKFLCSGKREVLVQEEGVWKLVWTGVVPVYLLKDGSIRTYKNKVKDNKYVKPKPSGFAIEYLGCGLKDEDGLYVLDGKDVVYDDKGKVLMETLGLPFVPWQRTEDTAFMVLTLKSAVKHIKPEQVWERPQITIPTPTIEWVKEYKVEEKEEVPE